MIERVKRLIDCKSKSVREFANMINVKQVTLNQQITGSRSLSLDVVSAILNSFEDISAEWLLRGTGSMIVSENTEFSEKLSDGSENYSTIRELQDKIVALEAENNVLREMVGLQKNKQCEGKSA
ncbi:MAG: XRE family transcriptional regulator [Phocaeicola sp.]